MEKMPTIREPKSKHDKPAAIKVSPSFMGKRNPHREANTPEHATAHVEATYCALKSAPAWE
jgi:hypothetical protein